MKYSLFVLVFAFLLASCSKNELNTEGEANFSAEKSTALLNEVRAIRNKTASKSAYLMLSPTEKTKIWQMHFADYLSKSSLNVGQRNLIIDMKKLLNPDLFSTVEKSREFLLNKEVVTLMYNIKNEFNENQIYHIFGSVNKPEITLVAPPDDDDCECNSNSDFCNAETATCIKRMWHCEESSFGCGWLLLQSCDGLCGA